MSPCAISGKIGTGGQLVGSALTMISSARGSALDQLVFLTSNFTVMSEAALFARLAKPVLDLGRYLSTADAKDLIPLLKEAKERLDAFEVEAIKAGAPESSTAAARYGLLVVLDRKGRKNTNIPLKRWSAGIHGTLFEGTDVSLSGLKEHHHTARGAGPAYRDIATFLQHCIDASEEEQFQLEAQQKSLSWRGIGMIAIFGVLIGTLVLFWYHRTSSERALASLDAPYNAVISQASVSPDELKVRLDTLYDAVEAIEVAHKRSMLSALPFSGPSTAAKDIYRDALRITLPRLLTQSLRRSLAQEEDPLHLYDSLRAKAILEQTTRWSPSYLTEWAQTERRPLDAISGLSEHIARMNPLQSFKVAIDAETLNTAREIASEATLESRAFLELVRLEEMIGLPQLTLTDRIPGLSEVLVSRSGIPLSKPIEGLFTKTGWARANDAATKAVSVAQEHSTTLLGAAPGEIVAPAPLLQQLQAKTNQRWRNLLNDLRVRPFDDQGNAIRISGMLGSPNNPLTELFTTLWEEVGGNDRTRSHQNQLDIAVNFGPLIQYVEAGKMAEVANLFSGLNVALAALLPGDEVSARRLLDVNARARSISALSTAPTIVSQIVEDVISQAAGATSEALGNPAQLAWEQDVLFLCRATLAAYPFVDGDNASLKAFTDLFSRNGALARFDQVHLQRLLDRSEDPWRWKPEALFSGFNRDTAEFFQAAHTLTQGLFGENDRLTSRIVFTSLGQSMPTTLSVGGRAAVLSNDQPPVEFIWPGDRPDQGFEVKFGETDRLYGAGDWGLLRITDNLRLRVREEGKRYRVDFKGTTGRLFVDMDFEDKFNLISLRPLMDGLACPNRL